MTGLVFSYFSLKPYVVTPHLNRLSETVQLKGHNTCNAEFTKIIPNSQQILPLIYLELCRCILDSCLIYLQKLKAEELAKEQEKIRQKEEALRKEEEERNKKLQQDAEELWLRQQEDRFRELQEIEKEKVNRKDKHDPNVLLVDVPLPPISGLSLNNERVGVPSGTLEYTPNDLRQGTRPKLEKNLSFENPPNIPDRELKKSLTIIDGAKV